jgi:hypothetical protein
LQGKSDHLQGNDIVLLAKYSLEHGMATVGSNDEILIDQLKDVVFVFWAKCVLPVRS